VFVLYEAGLNELLQRLGTGHTLYDDALVYEQRLTENIASCRRYGDSSERKTERAEIIDRLNEVSVSALGLSFNDICEQLPTPGSAEQDRLVHKALTNQRTLLLVDNLESITDRRVRLFLRNLPAPTKAIITSREWVDVADVLRLTGLPAAEAVQYIAEEAAMREVTLDDAQRQRIFDLTAGLPLPIKLSIARMSSGESFDAVTRWLGDATGDLPEYCVKGLSDLLRDREPHAWHLLLACTLFDRDAGASREALGAVANLSLADRDNGLARLMRFSLINRTDEDRFWLMPIVQRYASAILDNSELEEPMVDRWLAWLVEFAEQWGKDLELHIERVPLVGIEYPNLYKAIQYGKDTARWDTLVLLAEGTWFYPYVSGIFQEVEEILTIGIEATRKLNLTQQEGAFACHMGRFLRVRHHYEQAQEQLDRALDIAHQYQDEIAMGRVWDFYLEILKDFHHWDRIEELTDKMLEISTRLDNVYLKTSANRWLFELESNRKNVDQAQAYLLQSEQLAKQLGWSRELSYIIYRRGCLFLNQANYPAAEQFFMQSMEMATSWEDRRLLAHCKSRLGQLYTFTNRRLLADQMNQEARDLYERMGLTDRAEKITSFMRQLQTDDPLLRELLANEEA
jgi:tetratricopeptide (TPR) repeat protein